MKLKIYIPIVCNLIAFVATAQPGTLDSDFSSDGKVTVAFNSSTNNIASAVLVQPNQKILVAGTFYDGSNYNAAVARLNEDGSLDGSFGTGGKFTSAFTLGDTKINGMILQPDGKIVLAGSWDGQFTQEIFLIARLLPNGTPDSTFGGDGFIITSIGAKSVANAVVIQNDSLIVAGGYSYASGGTSYNDFTLVRYKPNGVVDSSFSVNGIVTTDFYSWSDAVYSLAITHDNKIIASGYANEDGSGGERFAVAKYNFAGTLDLNFSNNGKVDYEIELYLNRTRAMLIQPDEKIVLAGNGFTLGVVVRLKPDGSLDTTFNVTGKKTFPMANGTTGDEIHGAALQPDGKILVAGFFDGGSTKFTIARLKSDGVIDSTFGTNGFNNTNNDWGSKAFAMTLQNDGRVVAAGFSRSLTFVSDTVFAIARFYTGLTLGVLNFSAEQKTVTVYPNPVDDFINLKYTLTQSEKISIRLFDMQGRLVATLLENETQPEGEIEKQLLLTNDLNNGNYLLSVVSETGSVSVRLIKH